MMHRCVKCGKNYSEKSPQLLEGCPCGSKIFLLIKNAEEAKGLGDTSWIGDEFREFVRKHGKPVSLEVENIKMLERGVFELNLKSLILDKEPIILKDAHGVYYIKLPQKGSSASALAEGKK